MHSRSNTCLHCEAIASSAFKLVSSVPASIKEKLIANLVIAQPTDGTLRHLDIGHCSLGLEDQIGMAGHLSHCTR